MLPFVPPSLCRSCPIFLQYLAPLMIPLCYYHMPSSCWQINDALLRTLEAERAGKPIPVEDDDTSAGAAGGAPLLDLGGGSEDPLAGKVSIYRALVGLTLSLFFPAYLFARPVRLFFCSFSGTRSVGCFSRTGAKGKSLLRFNPSRQNRH